MTLRDSSIAESIQTLLLDDLLRLAESFHDEMGTQGVSASQPTFSRPFQFSCDDDFRSRMAYLNMENILVWGSNLMTESSPSFDKFLAAAEQLKHKVGLGNHHAIRAMLVYPSPFEIQVPIKELELRSRILSEVQLVHLSECDPSPDLPEPATPIKDPIPADPMTSGDMHGLCQAGIQDFLASFEKIVIVSAEETCSELLTLKVVQMGLLFLQSTQMYRMLSSKIEAIPNSSSLFPVLQMHLRFLVLERTLIASLSAKLSRVRAQNLPLKEFISESSMLVADYKVHQKHIQESLVSLVNFRHQKDLQVSSGQLSIPQNSKKKSARKHQKFGTLSLSQFSRRTDGPLEVIQESKVSEVSEASREPKSIRWDSFDDMDDQESARAPRIAVSGPEGNDEPMSIVVLPLNHEEAPQEMSHDDLDLADEVDLGQPIGISSIKKDTNNSSLSQSFKPSNQFANEDFLQQSSKKQSQILDLLNPKKQDSMILSEDTEFSKEESREVSSSIQRTINVPKSPQMRPGGNQLTSSLGATGPINSANSNISNPKTPSSGSNMTARYEAAVNNSKQPQHSLPKESGQQDSMANTQNNQFTLGAQQTTVMQSPLRKAADVFDSAISESQELHQHQKPAHESRMIYEVPKLSRLQQPLSDMGNEPGYYDPLSSGREAPRSVFMPTENKNVPIMQHKMPRENSTKNLNLSASGPLHGLQSMAFSESLTNLVRGREESAPTPAFMSGSINQKLVQEHPLHGLTEQTGARINLNQSQFGDIPYSPVTKVTTPHFNLTGNHPEDFTESQVVRKPNIPRADRKNTNMHSSSIRNDEKSGQLDGSVLVGGWTQSPNNHHETHSIRTMTTHTNNRHYMAIGASSISRPAVHLDVDLSTYNSEYGNNQIGDDRTSATGLTGRGFIPMENPFSHYDDTAPSKTNVIENLGDKALALKALDTSSVFNPSCINGNFPSGMKPTPNTAGKHRGAGESYYQTQSPDRAKQNNTANRRNEVQKKPEEPPSGMLGISTFQQPRTIGSSLIPSESSLMVTREQYQNRSDMMILEDRRIKPASAAGSENMDAYDLKFAMSVNNQQQSFKSRAGTTHHQIRPEDYDLSKGQHKHSSMHFKEVHTPPADDAGQDWHRTNTTPNSQLNIHERSERPRSRTNYSLTEASATEPKERGSSKQTWRAQGFYEHFGKQVAMNFSQLKCEVGGVIQGQGVDDNGVFGITGQIKQNREVKFNKQHLGMQSIAFKGFLNSSGSKIEGSWEFGGMQGGFCIESANLLADQTTQNTGGNGSRSSIAPKLANSTVALNDDMPPHKSVSNPRKASDSKIPGIEDESSQGQKKKNLLEISKSVNYADNSMKSPNESGPLNSIFRSSVDHNKDPNTAGGANKKADSVFYERDEEDLTSLPSPKFNGKKLGLLSNTSHPMTLQASSNGPTHMPKLNIPTKLDKDTPLDMNYSVVNNISKRVSDTQRVEIIDHHRPDSQAQSLNTNRISDLQEPPISKRCQSGSVDPNILSIMKHKEPSPHKVPLRIAIDPHNYTNNTYSPDPSKEQDAGFDSLHTAPHQGQHPRHMYPPIPREHDYGSGKQSQVRFSGITHGGGDLRNSFAHHSGLSSSQLKPPHYHSFGPVYESGFTLGRKRGEDSRKSLEESGVSGRVAQAINKLVSKLSGNQLKSDAMFVNKDLQRLKNLHGKPKIGSAELFTSMNEDLALNHHSAVEEDVLANEDVKILAEALALLMKDASHTKTPKGEVGYSSAGSGDRDNLTQASPATSKLEAELALVRQEAAHYKKTLEDVTKHKDTQDEKLEEYKETLIKSQKDTESKIIQMMKEYQAQVEQLKLSIRAQESTGDFSRSRHRQSVQVETQNEGHAQPDSQVPVHQGTTDGLRMSATNFFTSNLVQPAPQESTAHHVMRRSAEVPVQGFHQPMISNLSGEYTTQQSTRAGSRQRVPVGAKNLLDYYKEELDRKNNEIKECELNLREEKRKAERLAEELSKNTRELSEKKSEVWELEKHCENLSKKNLVLNMSCERLRFSENVLAKDFDTLKHKFWRRSHASSPTLQKQVHKRGGSFDHYQVLQPKLDQARLSHSSHRFSSATEDGITEDSQLKSGARPLPAGFLKLLAKQRNRFPDMPIYMKSSRKSNSPQQKKLSPTQKQSLSKDKLRREVCFNYGDSLIFPFTKESAPQQSFVRELKKGQSLALMKKYAIDNGIKSFGRKGQKPGKETGPRQTMVPRPPEDKSRPSSNAHKRSPLMFDGGVVSESPSKKYPMPQAPKPRPAA